MLWVTVCGGGLVQQQIFVCVFLNERCGHPRPIPKRVNTLAYFMLIEGLGFDYRSGDF